MREGAKIVSPLAYLKYIRGFKHHQFEKLGGQEMFDSGYNDVEILKCTELGEGQVVCS
ncbi:hypothetical protein HMPREF9104_00244 [Lentilactobacillus kisonensis F0435]|uniref:Uncharacterized protein n=1 Tax=Lentilactobacillus kisonensis F0435 TaxID=797516 RepID=H1LCD1_9LACO|nr:hypothetical protein HMPREF9104_00244 [Lentilactobacillus kisonensis F0435]